MKALSLIFIILVGCAGDGALYARGDASATNVTSKVYTVDSEGTETCTERVERTVVGGQGSSKLYEVISIVLGGISVLLSALQ